MNNVMNRIASKILADLEPPTDTEQSKMRHLMNLRERMMRAVLRFTKHPEPTGLDQMYYNMCMSIFLHN